MSTAVRKGTRLFGMQVNADPKLIVGALLVFAAVMFWYNSASDESGSTPTTAGPIVAPSVSPAPSPGRPATLQQRRVASISNDRGTLRLRAIDATRGDVDPTLRLDLLNKLKSIQQSSASRSLFELGAAPQSASASAPKIVGPIIQVKNPVLPSQPNPNATLPLAVTIPFKYYGYVKPTSPVPANKGLFLEGDTILVASEGELVKQRYLVVELTPNSARVEDTQLKQGQTLPVTPAATQ